MISIDDNLSAKVMCIIFKGWPSTTKGPNMATRTWHSNVFASLPLFPLAFPRRLPHHPRPRKSRRRRLPASSPSGNRRPSPHRRARRRPRLRLVEIRRSRCRLQRVGIRRRVPGHPGARRRVPEHAVCAAAAAVELVQLERSVDGEDVGVGEVGGPGSDANGWVWHCGLRGRGNRAPDSHADAAVVVGFRLRSERHLMAVERDDVTVEFDSGDGSSCGTWELGFDQKCCGSVFEQEEE